MKFTELKNDIKEGARSIYLLEGDDAYFRMKAEEQIKAAFLEMPELNYVCFDGTQYKGAKLTEITAAIESYPFMSPKRIVKITDFYPAAADYERYLQNTFEQMPESSVLLIVNTLSGKGVDLKKKKCVHFVDCDRADAETVTKWAYLTLKRAGIAAPVEACEAIAAYCLCDMSRVSVEVNKLISYGGERGTIGKSDVDDLVYKDADYRFYELTNALARKNYSLFTEIMVDLTSKGTDRNTVLSSLFSYFKTLLVVHSSDQSDKRLAEILNTREFVVKRNREQARSFGEKRLKAAVNGLYELLAESKNGGLTPEGALGCAVARLFFD